GHRRVGHAPQTKLVARPTLVALDRARAGAVGSLRRSGGKRRGRGGPDDDRGRPPPARKRQTPHRSPPPPRHVPAPPPGPKAARSTANGPDSRAINYTRAATWRSPPISATSSQNSRRSILARQTSTRSSPAIRSTPPTSRD